MLASVTTVLTLGIVLIVLAVGVIALSFVLEYLRDARVLQETERVHQQELLVKTLDAMQLAVSATAKAVGEAVAASFPAPVAPTEAKVVDYGGWLRDPDIEDGTIDPSDPTDNVGWLGGERPEGVSIGRVGGEVFGVPGLTAVRPPVLDGRDDGGVTAPVPPQRRGY